MAVSEPALPLSVAEEDADAVAARMRTFFRADQSIAAAVLVVGVILAVTSIRHPVSLAFLGAIAVNIAAVEWCHRRINADNYVRYGVAASLVVWAMALVIAPMVSFALPVVLLPVLVTMLAIVPFLDRRRALLWIGGGAVVLMGIAALALSFEGPIDQRIPDPVADAIVVLGIAAFAVPTSLLAWDLFVRHAVALERLESSNEALRASRSRLVAVADEERQRVERDLHDGAQQRLVAVMMQVRLLSRLHENVRGDLEPVVDDLATAIEDLRDLAHGIYPPLLESRGLGPALASAVRRTPVAVELDVSTGARYSRPIEIAVYFVCLEALQNVTKYAGSAASARVTLADDGEHLLLAVADDGAGFDPTTEDAGRGLRNMEDRVGAIDGRLVIESGVGEGTIVSAFVPHGGACTPA